MGFPSSRPCYLKSGDYHGAAETGWSLEKLETGHPGKVDSKCSHLIHGEYSTPALMGAAPTIVKKFNNIKDNPAISITPHQSL